MAPSRYYSSVARRTTLTADINGSTTSITVAAATGFPATTPYTLIIDQDTVNEEIVEVTNRSGTTLTVTRGVDGTSGIAHTAGASVEHGVSARDFADSRAHEDASEAVHGLAAGQAVVGTSTAQTLSNKTLGSDLAAGGFRVTGLADPSSAQDAVTKNWAETGMTSQLNLASASAVAAGNSASAAAASASAAAASLVASQSASAVADSAATAAAASSVSASASYLSASAAEVGALAAQVASENARDFALDWATKTSGTVDGSEFSAKFYAASASGSSASAAASSAAAAVSASAAAADAISAANSAAAAATSLDSFDDRYLGSKSVAPTVDNDGDPLVTGALFYLNTGTAEQIGMYVYDGASWLKASAASVASIVTYEYTATNGQTVFTGADDNAVSLSFTSGLIQVFLNGVLLSPGDDYTTSTNTVTLASGAALNDVLVVVAFASFNAANTYTIAQADGAFVAKSTVTAKGDLLAASANGVVDNLPVGADATVLVADSGASFGIKWDTLSSEQVPKAGINTQTGTTYTFVAADAGKFVSFGSASATTATVPTNASVAYATGTVINLVQLGAGQVTVAGASGVTVSAPDSATKLAAQYAAAQLLKTATDDWVLIGNITA